MKQLTTLAIIYKIHQYSDRSAIAVAITPEYGKIKFFIPKAFTKKGGLMKFVPGTLTVNMKDTSDMHKFISFSHDTVFYHYTQTTEIVYRLHLIFDFYDHMFDIGQPSKVFWTLCLKYSAENYKEITVYTVYRLMRDAGLMFELNCSACGETEGDMQLKKGELYCVGCNIGADITIPTNIMELMQIFPESQLYKDVTVSHDQERDVLIIFQKHLEAALGKNSVNKSLDIFLSLNI